MTDADTEARGIIAGWAAAESLLSPYRLLPRYVGTDRLIAAIAAALRARETQTVEALRPYAKHLTACAVFDEVEEARACDCGLARAMQSTGA